jgi:hypothetical protein
MRLKILKPFGRDAAASVRVSLCDKDPPEVARALAGRFDGSPVPDWIVPALKYPRHDSSAERGGWQVDFCIPSWARAIIPGRSPVQPKSASSGMPPKFVW